MPNSRFARVASVALTFAVLALSSTSVHAQEIGGGNDLGIGLGKGTLSSGISGKYYLSERSAIQAHLGASYIARDPCDNDRFDDDCDAGAFGLNVDYVYTFQDLYDDEVGRLFLSGGGGGAVASGRGIGGVLAANGVFELGWHFSEFPLEIVFDWRPLVAFSSYGTGLYFFDIGFSVRYFFET